MQPRLCAWESDLKRSNLEIRTVKPLNANQVCHILAGLIKNCKF